MQLQRVCGKRPKLDALLRWITQRRDSRVDTVQQRQEGQHSEDEAHPAIELEGLVDLVRGGRRDVAGIGLAAVLQDVAGGQRAVAASLRRARRPGGELRFGVGTVRARLLRRTRVLGFGSNTFDGQHLAVDLAS